MISGQKPLIILRKRSILDIRGALNAPLRKQIVTSNFFMYDELF